MRCTWMDTMPRPIKHRPSLDIYIPSTYNIDRPSEAVLQKQTKSPFTGSTFQCLIICTRRSPYLTWQC